MEIIIESKTKPENPKKGIKYNEAWHTVVGRAANYVDTLIMGDVCEVREGENGVVTFIQKKGDAGEEKVETEAANEIVQIEEKLQAIIAQNSVNNALLLEIAKKLTIDINSFKPASEV